MAQSTLTYILILLFTIHKSESYSDSANSVFNSHHSIINNDLFKDLVNKYIDGDDRDSEKTPCENQFSKIIEGIKNQEEWALELIDSWGKIPSGILWYHIAALGSYEECLNITKEFDSGEKLQGKYCLASVPIGEILELLPKPETRMIMQNPQTGKMGLQIGVCIPSLCSAKEINEAVNSTVKEAANITLNSALLSEDACYVNTPIKLRAVDWAAIAVFTFIGILILVSSIYEFIIISKGGSGKQFLLSFSIFSNGTKIFQMKRNNSPNVIECLHGIRSLSIIWVVFGHTYTVVASSPNINMKHMLQWLQTVFSMLLQTATVSVDSFFLMSGLLVAWIMMNELRRQGSLNVPLIYFHRYLRLTPVLAASILFSVSIANYIGSGPYWNLTKVFLTTSCEKYWWSTLLYVQNYVNPGQMCLGHTWYLSVDTQMFLFAPLIMFCLWKWGVKFIPVIVILMCSSIGYTFYTVLKHNYPVLLTADMLNSQERMELIYYPTHTRISPWLVGILLGWYLHSIKGRKIHLSKVITSLLWLTSFLIMGAIIFGPYPKTYPEAVSYPIESAFYESISRVAWSIALAIVIFLCYTGYGGIINSMLSLPFWQPISRLSYCIYMTHLIVQALLAASVKNDTHFSDFDVIHKFWGDFAITFMASLVLSLAFESPIVGIERIIFKKEKSSPSRENLCATNANGTNTVEQNNI